MSIVYLDGLEENKTQLGESGVDTYIMEWVKM